MATPLMADKRTPRRVRTRPNVENSSSPTEKEWRESYSDEIFNEIFKNSINSLLFFPPPTYLFYQL